MCFRIYIREACRERLAIASGILQILLALFGVLLIFFAVYINIRIEKQMLLLQDYNSGLLPHFLISLGSLMIVIHLFGAKISFDLSSSETRDKFLRLSSGFSLLLCALAIVIVAGGSVCFAHRKIIEDSLKHGLKAALRAYKTESSIKRTIDKIQLGFQCCGSSSYRDWFDVSWISNSYIDLSNPEVKGRLRNGEYFTNSVPFSCCSWSYPRSCVHYNMISNSSFAAGNSVNVEGCTLALGTFFADTVLIPAGNTVFSALGVELLVIVMFRFLQTSIVNAEEEGDPEGPGEGFICEGSLCCESRGDLSRYSRKKERDAAAADTDYEDDDTGDGFGGFGGGGDDTFGGGGEDGGKSRKNKDKQNKKQDKKNAKENKKEKKDKKQKDKSKAKKDVKAKKESSPKKSKSKDSPKSKKKSSPVAKSKASPKKKSSPKKPARSKSPKKSMGRKRRK